MKKNVHYSSRVSTLLNSLSAYLLASKPPDPLQGLIDYLAVYDELAVNSKDQILENCSSTLQNLSHDWKFLDSAFAADTLDVEEPISSDLRNFVLSILMPKSPDLRFGILKILLSNLVPSLSELKIDVKDWKLLHSCSKNVSSFLKEKVIAEAVRTGPNQNRTKDGISDVDVMDQGRCKFFKDRESTFKTLEEVLASVQFDFSGFWLCSLCNRSTSENREEHNIEKHGGVVAEIEPKLATKQYIIDTCLGRSLPAVYGYTLETPLFRVANKTQREFKDNPVPFQVFREYALLLDQQLRSLPVFEGIVYRAVDFIVPARLYEGGNVVTWNQTSSASYQPSVVKNFLATTAASVKGTIFIITSISGRCIDKHSIFPEECEVVFRAGVQFRIKQHVTPGIKRLLAAALDCDLSFVTVIEMQEIVLDFIDDVPLILRPDEISRNGKLLTWISEQDEDWSYDPISHSDRYARTSLSELPMEAFAACILPQNCDVFKLMLSRTGVIAFDQQDELGLTLIQMCMLNEAPDCALWVLRRSVDWVYNMVSISDVDLLLQWACIAGLPFAIIKKLLSCWSIDISTPKFATLVFLCAALGRAALLHGFLRINPSFVDTLDSNENSLLHVALDPKLLEAEVQEQIQSLRYLQTGSSPTDGNLVCVSYLLSFKANVNLQAPDGYSPLHRACCNPSIGIEFIRILLQNGSDIHTKASYLGFTPMHLSASNGKVDCIRFLHFMKADILAVCDDGNHPLHVSAGSGHVESVRTLHELKADINAPNNKQCTPINYAAKNGHSECVRLFLELNADILPKDDAGYSPFLSAALAGDVGCLQLLFAANADWQVKDNDGDTPLHMAVCDKGREDSVSFLIQLKADVSARNEAGRTPLHYAHPDCMNLLIDNKADILAKDKECFTPIHGATENGYAEGIRILCRLNADVNSIDNEGNTPLHFTTSNENVDCIRALIDLKANVESKNHIGKMVIHAAAEADCSEAITLLCQHNASVLSADQNGNSALHIAASEGKVDSIQIIINLKGNVLLENLEGQTPLHCAAKNDQSKCISILFSSNADIRAKTKNGETPIEMCSEDSKCFRILTALESGKEVEDEDDEEEEEEDAEEEEEEEAAAAAADGKKGENVAEEKKNDGKGTAAVDDDHDENAEDEDEEEEGAAEEGEEEEEEGEEGSN